MDDSFVSSVLPVLHGSIGCTTKAQAMRMLGFDVPDDDDDESESKKKGNEE